MKLISLKLKGFKNLDFWDNPIDFTKSEGISIFVGNNGSGKSNVLEAISAIFYGLYDETNERRCNFTYELEYKIDGKNIKLIQLFFKGKKDAIGKLPPEILAGIPNVDEELRFVSYYIDGKYTNNFDRKFLPSQIIALYSGEETRLYENYYLDDYEDYIKSIITNKKGISEEINMSFIGKDFWNIALITLYVSDFDLSKIVGFYDVENINILFEFNEKNINNFNTKSPNEVTNFVIELSKFTNITLIKFVESFYYTHKDLFKILSVSYLPKEENYKLIDSIDLELSNGSNKILASGLSEGQKKQILIYFVTQILADKDSIILLDEPDSYIHVGNKKRLKEFFDDFLDITKEGEFIMTTHSPTLMNKFDKKHLFYLENGKLDLKEKREILDNITDGQMSLYEMEVFLNSGNKYLLVTEGITDKKHLEIAIEKLGIKNNYDIYSADGADKLKQFLIGLPKDFFKEKIIVGIFDYDTEGLNNLKIGDLIEENKIYKVRDRDNIFGVTLPYYDEKFAQYKNFTIEFMYSEALLKQYNMLEKRKLNDVNCGVKSQDLILSTREYPNEEHLCFYKISELHISKNDFTEIVRKLECSEFENFRPLLDLIDSFK